MYVSFCGLGEMIFFKVLVFVAIAFEVHLCLHNYIFYFLKNLTQICCSSNSSVKLSVVLISI